jgi:hypothetical protein
MPPSKGDVYGIFEFFGGAGLNGLCAQLAVGCRLDRSPIDPLHVFSGMGTVTLYFHNKFDLFHGLFLPPRMTSKGDKQMGGV